MTKSELLHKIETMLELDSGVLVGNETLEDIPNWDSLAIMGFIALVDKNFGYRIPGKQLMSCKTVAHLISLLGDRIQD